MNNSFSSSLFPFTVKEVVNRLPILEVKTPSGAFAAYQVGMGGRSYQTLRAARTAAKRLTA